MKRGEVAIKNGNQEWATKTGWLFSPFFGAWKGNYGGWNLTHRPTGFALGPGFHYLKDAERAAAFLNERANWSFTNPQQLTEAHNSAYRVLRVERVERDPDRGWLVWKEPQPEEREAEGPDRGVE